VTKNRSLPAPPASVSVVADGWREHRAAGGQVIDVASGEVVAQGLSMPHSPRLHKGTLCLLNAGSGEFGRLDVASGKFEPIAFCPGFLRGMSFLGDYALVGLSLPRENRTFSGLALDDALKSRGAEPRCGVMVIDLTSGGAPHWLRFEGVVQELYDVAAILGRRARAAIGFMGEEVRRMVSIGEGPGA